MADPSLILVTGATGNVGRSVVSGLLKTGAAVRVLTRQPASTDVPGGVDVVRGDLSLPGTLAAGLDGVDSVFLVWPTLTADHAAPAALDAIARRARHIVYLSAMGVPDDPGQETGAIIASHARIERLIERSGMAWTVLRPAGFAANTLMWAPQIRADGVVRWPYAAASRSLIHERDIAAVGVRVLTAGGHHKARYHLTGPQSLTQAEQVRAIGDAIGRPLRFEEIPPEVARRRMPADMPPWLADEILAAHAAMVTRPERVTSAVEEITGQPARTFRGWANDHADDFR